MIKFCHLRCLPPLDVVFVTFFTNYVLIKVGGLVDFGCAVIIALVLVLHRCVHALFISHLLWRIVEVELRMLCFVLFQPWRVKVAAMKQLSRRFPCYAYVQGTKEGVDRGRLGLEERLRCWGVGGLG